MAKIIKKTPPKPRVITELPYGLSGRVFRSPMPFSEYDPEHLAFSEIKAQHVHTIVLLTESFEYLQQTGEDLKTFYEEEGFEVLHLPIVDFGVPNREDLDKLLEQILERILNRKSVAMHCLAGLGRTGLVAACLAQRVFGFNGSEALLWVRQHIPGAVQSEAQIRFLLDEGK